VRTRASSPSPAAAEAGGAAPRGIPATEGTRLRRAPYHMGKIRQVELATPERGKRFAQFVSHVRAATSLYYPWNCTVVLFPNGSDPNHVCFLLIFFLKIKYYPFSLGAVWIK
jgi:hypothetical protein